MTKMNRPRMTYNDRLREFEREKKSLDAMGLNPMEYEQMIRALARKWRV